MTLYYQDKWITVHHGDCREVMRELAEHSIDSTVTDPPYELGFMGKAWDRSGIAYNVEVWRECLRVLKPGGHLLAFGGSRTYHRLACAIEDAGFEIRDQIQWIYGSGFPKSLDVSKAIDAAVGAKREVVSTRNDGVGNTSTSLHKQEGFAASREKTFEVTVPATDAAKQWDGWGTALKPAHEPIVLARKPLVGTVAANVLGYGTGGLNIDECRIGVEERTYSMSSAPGGNGQRLYGGDGRNAQAARRYAEQSKEMPAASVVGRWPANVIHDGSEEVVAGFPETDSSQISMRGTMGQSPFSVIDGSGRNPDTNSLRGHNDNGGSAARFFYCAKADKADRNEGLEYVPMRSAGEVTNRKDGSDGLNSPRAGAGRTGGSRNFHPTVKPTDLMRYLCRLVTPPHGTVLDPFCGSGSTGKAAALEEFRSILIDLDIQHCELAANRALLVQESFFSR